MSNTENKLKEIQKELQWVTIRDEFAEPKKSNVKTVYNILVPIGVLVTTGVLGTGLYYMMKRNSIKQQSYMRYRVLAQGITVCLATIGTLHLKFSS